MGQCCKMYNGVFANILQNSPQSEPKLLQGACFGSVSWSVRGRFGTVLGFWGAYADWVVISYLCMRNFPAPNTKHRH